MAMAQNARKQLPALRRQLSDLIILSENAFPANVGQRSHTRFMLATFAAKQIAHNKSMLKLGYNIDTLLVARSMLEGMSQLLWAFQQPKRRPLMWRAFVYIVDWRLLQEHKSAGKAVDPAVARSIRQGLRRYGTRFFTKKARAARAQGRPLPADPYARNWYSEREADIFRAVGGQVLYEKVYGPFSEWHHWRPVAFGRLLSFDAGNSSFTMTTSDPSQVAIALAIGFQCLWQTMRLFNSRCRLGLGAELQRLRRQQLALGK